MAQTRRATMHLGSVFILLFVAVVVESCNSKTHYEQGGECCKKCEPGKMMAGSSCTAPFCVDCGDGEYQDEYNTNNLCKRQPTCDPNLNLQTPERSLTQKSPCVCKPDHHCSSESCDSCVRNAVCKAGEKVSKHATEKEDTVCVPCPAGTFSTNKSASTCKYWTECSTKVVIPGSSTSDRVCEEQSQKLAVIVPIVLVVLLLVVGFLAFFFYRKARTESISFVKMAREFCGTKTHQPVETITHIENGQPENPPNQPQEDTDEDLLKNEEPLLPGISEKGQPVSQDNSKSLLLSEAETEPGSFQERF